MKVKIEIAKERFGKMLEMQLERISKINEGGGFKDYKALSKIVIGMIPGDGIGPYIAKEAERVLIHLLKEEIGAGKVELRQISGLSYEEREKMLSPIPGSALEQIKACDVLLKGPITTNNATTGAQNVESTNVAIRRILDLFANVRPVRIPEFGVEWTFFRENTEGGYAVGSEGIEVDRDLAVDFTVVTTEGCERVIRAAFEFAAANGKKRVTAVTKANIIKTTDGKFLTAFYRIATEYPEISADDWYVDIMAAKLLDEKRRSGFEVFVMPNLYGDILTDEAAQLQGGVGTAGGANIGKQYAMFEAIHGSALRMVEEGRAPYADPTSILRAAAMLLIHIGYSEYAEMLEKALDTCASEKRVAITGGKDGATCAEYTDYVMEKLGGLM